MKLGKDAIELWCMKVEALDCREPMDNDLSKYLITIMLQKDRIDQDAELLALVETKKAGILSAFWLRVKACHTFEITMSAALFLDKALFTNFGMSTMVANYLQYMAHKHDRHKINIEFICTEVWPLGFPTKEQWDILWAAQKVDRESVRRYFGCEPGDVVISDNILDYAEFRETIMIPKNE